MTPARSRSQSQRRSGPRPETGRAGGKRWRRRVGQEAGDAAVRRQSRGVAGRDHICSEYIMIPTSSQ